MRPLVRLSALSAIVVVIAVLATACTTNTTIGADSPEATEDQGVAVEPLLAATPTVTPPSSTETATSIPTETATATATATEPTGDTTPPTFDRVANPDLGDGDYPFVNEAPAVGRVPDLVPVDVTAEPARLTNSRTGDPELAAIQTTTTTPDGESIWVGITAQLTEDASRDCAQGPTTRLAVQPLTGRAAAAAAEPADALPVNISAIHHGPDNNVLFYTSCDGETRPAAFATVESNGDFSNVQRLDPLLTATTFAGVPQWHYGGPSESFDHFDIGELIVSVPQQGLVATGEDPGTTSTVYIDVATGSVIDVWASPAVWRTRVGYHQLTSDGSTAELNEPVDLLGLSIATIVARPAAANDVAAALIGGGAGSLIVRPSYPDIEIERLGDQPVAAAAWAPVGPWIALTGAGGTWLYGNGQTIDLSNFVGEAIYFSPDGSKLVVAKTGSYQVIEFAQVERPSDDTRITPFSTLDSGGLGPIRVESLVSDLRAELDMQFDIAAIDEINIGYCVDVSSPDLPGVYMLAQAVSQTDAIITTVVVREGPWTTPSGLRIGSAQSDVFQAFPGQVNEEPHTYVAGNYLTFVPSDPTDTYSIKFDTNGHQVTTMHAGRSDWISYVEGCA